MAQIKVIARDRLARRIEIECPHCRAQLSLTPWHVGKLESGPVTSIRCTGCGRATAVTLVELGGYLWTAPGQ
jgi:phage FluMu protein Com